MNALSPARLSPSDARRAAAKAMWDAKNGAGSWDRAMHEIHFGPNLIAAGPSVQDIANGRQ